MKVFCKYLGDYGIYVGLIKEKNVDNDCIFQTKKICGNRLSGLVATSKNVVRTAATRSIMILGEFIMKYMSCKAEILTVHLELKVKRFSKNKI